MTSTDTRPVLYQGVPVPFGILGPSSFEAFVTSCLGTIGPRHGFQVTGAAGASGDEGFDASAVRRVWI